MGYFAPIRQDEYPATDELQCVAVYLPAGDEYKALLAGFVAFLSDVNSYQDPESAQAEGIADVFETAWLLNNWEGCGIEPECDPMNTNVVLFPSTAVVKTGGAFIWVVNTSNELGGYWQQNPPLTGDKFGWEEFLAAGDWSYVFSYVRGTANGKADFKIATAGGSTLENVNFDLRGAALFNARFTGTFTVPAGGAQCDISLEGTGASSGSSYTRPIGRLEMWRTD